VIIDSVATSHMPTPGGFISAFNVFIEAVYSSILPREKYVVVVSRSACILACSDFTICRAAVLCVIFDD